MFAININDYPRMSTPVVSNAPGVIPLVGRMQEKGPEVQHQHHHHPRNTSFSRSSTTSPPPTCPTHPTPSLGPYTPTLILHGGAGSITRSHLPPSLYAQYANSLSSCAAETNALLQTGHSALDAACHAVSLMEDDELFNCGKGSVFTEDGEIEMEASVMVSSVYSPSKSQGSVKRGAAVSLIQEMRHPILLAREVLLQGDQSQELGTMHCHRSGAGVEGWGWKERNLERKGKEWFWTRKRWEEHLRGLKTTPSEENEDLLLLHNSDISHENETTNDYENEGLNDDFDGSSLPSQGTVGAVCMDSWGNLAVATSTGGLTNKKPGRIGDTPTLGAGFWAESWDQELPPKKNESKGQTQKAVPMLGPLDLAAQDLSSTLSSCLPSFTPPFQPTSSTPPQEAAGENSPQQYLSPSPPSLPSRKPHPHPQRCRAIALSGTGNGDSFLRTAAAHTVAAQCRFTGTSLSQAITNVAGYDGELQRSAGERWGRTGEGEGGIIGIEVFGDRRNGNEDRAEKWKGKRKIKGHIVADFNCGGMWRAWIDEKGAARVMVFREEYE